MDLKNINLNDDSLIHLLNFILSMIKEDRRNALDHHDTLAGMLGGPPGAEGMTGLELQLLLNDLSAALSGFLKNSAQSTDQAIKIAQLMCNHMGKMDKSASLSDDDRDEIEKLAVEFQKEQGIISDSFKFDTLGDED